VAGYQTGILLPGLFLRWVPILNNARIPGRAVLVVYLVTAMLVAIGLARRSRRTRLAMPLVASALVAADYIAVPLPLDRVEVPQLYRTIAHTPGAVLELPFGFRDGFGEAGHFDSQVLLNQTVHGRPILGGFVGRLSPVLRARYLADPVIESLLTASAGARITDARMTADARAARHMFSTFGVTTAVLNRHTAPAALVEYVERVLPIIPTSHHGELTVYAVR
jgi:hypothetical protein